MQSAVLQVEFMTTFLMDLLVIPPTKIGMCLISKKCCTTKLSYALPILTHTKPQRKTSIVKLLMVSSNTLLEI